MIIFIIQDFKMKKTITLLALVFCLYGKAQNEYLAIVNSANCSFNKFDSISNVHWILDNSSTIDENNHRYFFIGSPPNNTPSSLYIINTLTGGVISSYKMISSSTDSLLIGLEYDNGSDTLYGLLEADTLKKSYFVWIDLTNGAIHIISDLPGQYFGIGSSTYDKNHHRYFYSDGAKQYVIDARTGNVIFSYPSTPYNYLIKYNNSTDKLYGLSQPIAQQWEFDSITVSTGVAHDIATMPFQYIVSMPVIKAVNETHGKYICVGQTAGINRLCTIDINTGNVVYQPIDSIIGNNDNLIEFQYDNIQDTLFALHWGTYPTCADCAGIGQFVKSYIEQITIYPNPTQTNFTIETNNTNKQTLQIFDVNGKLVLSQSITGKTNIDATNLAEGVYNLSLINQNDVANKRLVIVR